MSHSPKKLHETVRNFGVLLSLLRSTPFCPFQARTEYLRKKARGVLQSAGGDLEDDSGKGEGGAVEHLNLFPLEESALKKGNEDYLQEKKDEKVLLPLFTSLVGKWSFQNTAL